MPVVLGVDLRFSRCAPRFDASSFSSVVDNGGVGGSDIARQCAVVLCYQTCDPNSREEQVKENCTSTISTEGCLMFSDEMRIEIIMQCAGDAEARPENNILPKANIISARADDLLVSITDRRSTFLLY